MYPGTMQYLNTSPVSDVTVQSSASQNLWSTQGKHYDLFTGHMQYQNYCMQSLFASLPRTFFLIQYPRHFPFSSFNLFVFWYFPFLHLSRDMELLAYPRNKREDWPGHSPELLAGERAVLRHGYCDYRIGEAEVQYLDANFRQRERERENYPNLAWKKFC
jgi:hypothetical protein